MLDSLFQDVRVAVRTLARRPAFALIAVATLALGIGANSAIFTLVDATLLRPAPFREPDRLVELWHDLGSFTTPVQTMTRMDEWREADLLDGLEGYQQHGFTLTGVSEPQGVSVVQVTPGLFDLLGVAPRLGRGFRAEEDTPGRDRVAIVSDLFWQRWFADKTTLDDLAIALDGEEYVVVGVMPRAFRFPNGMVQIWVPFVAASDPIERASQRVTMVARLPGDVTMEAAQAGVDQVVERLDRERPDEQGRVTKLYPVQRGPNPGTRRALLVFAGAVVLVLFIACANAANLLLAQASARQRDLAVRAALGAPRGRLVRQLLAESLLLAGVGGATGLLVAAWALDVLASLAPTEIQVFTINEIRLDPRALGFTLAVSAFSGVLFGLLPAWRASKPDVLGAVRDAGRREATGSHGRLRRVLVAAEVALSLTLLVGAGLLTNSFVRLTQVDPGYDPAGLMGVTIELPKYRYDSPERQLAFFDELVARAEALPGVEAVSMAGGIPPAGAGFSFGFGAVEIEGRPAQPVDDSTLMPWFIADPRYFDTIRIPIRRGRAFDERDRRGAEPVAIVGESMARRFWEGADPIGTRVRLGEDGTWRTVVGVAGDVRAYSLDEKLGPFEMYYPLLQLGSVSTRTLLVRSASDPVALAASLRALVRGLDPDLPIYRLETAGALVASTLAGERFNLLLMDVFAAIALALAVLGIYGVLSYVVGLRTREIGIRMALGADARDVLRLVVGQGLRPVAIGLGLGLAGSFWVTRLLASLLFEVSATDPATFGAVAALLALVAVAACWLPARRAAKVQPTEALRCE